MSHLKAIEEARTIYNPNTVAMMGNAGWELGGAEGRRLMAIAGIDRMKISADDDSQADGHTHRYFFNGLQVGTECNGGTVIYATPNAQRKQSNGGALV